jgi:hypothetical protein
LSHLAKLSTTFTFLLLFVSIDQTTIKASTSTARTYSPSRSSETGGHERLAKRKLSAQQHHHQPTSGFCFILIFPFLLRKSPDFGPFARLFWGWHWTSYLINYYPFFCDVYVCCCCVQSITILRDGLRSWTSISSGLF